MEPIKIDHEFYPDAPYVILWRKYKHKDERKNNWIREFRGRRMVVVDGGDKANYWEPYISFCTDSPHIYVKENSYTSTDNPNVRIGCYAPSDDVIKYFKKHGLLNCEKKLDVFFRGDLHYGREKNIKWLKANLKEEGCRFEIGKSKYDRKTYLKRMASSKTTLCLNGKGNRTRREWECMLCGSYPWFESKIKRPFFDELSFGIDEIHPALLWNEYYSGGKFANLAMYAKIMWVDNLRADIRSYAQYLFFAEKQIESIIQLIGLEKEHGLR